MKLLSPNYFVTLKDANFETENKATSYENLVINHSLEKFLGPRMFDQILYKGMGMTTYYLDVNGIYFSERRFQKVLIHGMHIQEIILRSCTIDISGDTSRSSFTKPTETPVCPQIIGLYNCNSSMTETRDGRQLMICSMLAFLLANSHFMEGSQLQFDLYMDYPDFKESWKNFRNPYLEVNECEDYYIDFIFKKSNF